jgi:DNA-directed RNA polymerase II subunit RPB1
MVLLQIAETVSRLCKNIVVVPGKDTLSIEAQKNATLLFSSLLRSTLSSKRVLQEYRLTPQVPIKCNY